MSRFFRRNNGSGSTQNSPASTSAPGSSASSMRTASQSSLALSTKTKKNNGGNDAREGGTSHLLLRPHHDAAIPAEQPPSDAELQVLRRLRNYVEGLIEKEYGSSSENGSGRQASSIEEAPSSSYEPWERRWLDLEGEYTTVGRYLKASSGDEKEAMRRLEYTLRWRREAKPDMIPPNDVRHEGETGKHVYSGFDYQCRPCLWLLPGRENTKASPRQIAFLTFGLERAFDLLPQGQSKVCLVIDFHNATQGNSPDFATQKKVLDILQNHCPERLGIACVINAPWWMTAIHTALSPFIDPLTRSKIRWNQDLSKIIPPAHLPKAYGGEYDFVWDKVTSWDDIVDFCGIVPESGYREHECFSKVSVEEEAKLRVQLAGKKNGGEVSTVAGNSAEGEEQKAKDTAAFAGNIVPDARKDDRGDEDEDGDEDGDNFDDAQSEPAS
ncbi:unnamed protein product [Jaminaea pallidilutea]